MTLRVNNLPLFDDDKQSSAGMKEYVYLSSADNSSPPLSSVKRDVKYHCVLIAWLPLNIALKSMKMGLYVNIKSNNI